VSTQARYAEAAASSVQSTALVPVSTALVPVVGDRPRIEVSPGPPKPVNAHRFFYVLGYLGLVAIVAGTWTTAVQGGAWYALFPIGIIFVGLGGLGVLIHTLYRPNERKVRHLLLALASLGVVAASAPLLQRISREVHAAAMIPRLQPLADEVLRDVRIRDLGRAGPDRVSLNGFNGPLTGSDGWLDGLPNQPELLAGILARDGISRGELQAYLGKLERAGVNAVEWVDGRLLLTPADGGNHWLLYVPPGAALPRPGTRLTNHLVRWHADPLGGGWYLVLPGER
jgi:hypothetical protein